MKSWFKDHGIFAIIVKSFLTALIAYTVIVFFSLNNIIAVLSAPFHEMTKMIEINKQKIIMQSLFAESELNKPEIIGKYQAANNQELPIFIYSKDGEDSLNEHEKNMASVLKMAQKYTPIAYRNELVYLLYRSYESQTYITTSEIEDFPEDIFEVMNTETRCRETRICTKFESEIQLSDRILISPFYDDLLTSKKTITMASPIYGDTSGVILGDLNADFHVDDYFSKDFKLYSIFQGEYKQNVIADKLTHSDDFVYQASFMADGNTSFVFKLSYSRIYFYHVWLFFALYIALFIIIYKWQEVQKKRSELKHVQRDAIKDALTGLYNRKIFESNFFINKVRTNPGSLIVIDGNKIKNINDTYGHFIGDLAIQCIADKMKESFRTSDFLIRTGGDEFVVILPGCSHENALILSKKLQMNIESSVFSHTYVPLSVSCGVVFSESEETFEDAILRADTVLYEQKNNGNNNE